MVWVSSGMYKFEVNFKDILILCMIIYEIYITLQ